MSLFLKIVNHTVAVLTELLIAVILVGSDFEGLIIIAIRCDVTNIEGGRLGLCVTGFVSRYFTKY